MPLPLPRNFFGKVEARFIIDARGAIERISFNSVPDREYTLRLLEAFRGFEFRPARRADGTPTRGAYPFTFDFRRPR